MAAVLDLGCGNGKLPAALQLRPDDVGWGVDVNAERIAEARKRYPERHFLCARGESLPFPNGSFYCVVSNVALPYMNIPYALAEVRRLLRPDGYLFFSAHPMSFTLQELRHCRRIVPFLYRLFVLCNGLFFHVTGRVLRVGNRNESFQTKRGMRIALKRAGFGEVTFLRPECNRLLVETSAVSASNGTAKNAATSSRHWSRAFKTTQD